MLIEIYNKALLINIDESSFNRSVKKITHGFRKVHLIRSKAIVELVELQYFFDYSAVEIGCESMLMKLPKVWITEYS